MSSRRAIHHVLRRSASLATIALFLAGADARAEEPATREEAAGAEVDQARRHFQAGLHFLRDPDGEKTEEAYTQFKLAYDLSKSPRILGNIGYCALQLQRDGEALAAYTEYLKQVPDIDPREREQIQRDLLTLAENSATVAITVKPGEATLVDTRITNKGTHVNVYPATSKVELKIRSGHHIIKARVNGTDRAVWEFDAEPKGTLSHEFDLTPSLTPPRTTEPRPAAPHAEPSPVPWVILGIGAAALAAGGATGIITLGKIDNLKKICEPRCPADNPEYASDRKSTSTFVTVTDSLLVGGVVLAGIGVTTLLLRPKAAPRKTGFNASAMCTTEGCLGGVRGNF